MYKVLAEGRVNPSQKQGLDVLENKIQGLYSPKGAVGKFWGLKVKVELAVFQDPKKGENKNNE